MEIPPITADDLTDVAEMTEKLENAIFEILDGNAHNLALSALIGAVINSTMAQCSTLNEVVTYRNIFMLMFDNAIKDIKLEKPEAPS